jgi:hypothetical protein
MVKSLAFGAYFAYKDRKNAENLLLLLWLGGGRRLGAPDGQQKSRGKRLLGRERFKVSRYRSTFLGFAQIH